MNRKGLAVGIVVLAGLLAFYFGSKYVNEKGGGGYKIHFWAHFHDASGLVSKSWVTIAGLTAGSIYDRGLDQGMARITIEVDTKIDVYDNAVLYKKSASLLGQYYLELDPGTESTTMPDGSVVHHRLLNDWDQIQNVVEPASMDSILRSVGDTVPVLKDTLTQVDNLVKGPVQDIAHDVDRTTQDLDDTIKQNQAVLNDTLARIDRIAGNVEDATGGTTPGDVHAILDTTKDAVGKLDDAITKADLPATAQSLRAALDRISASVDQVQHTVDNLSQITDTVRSGQGTVGELLEDPEVADNVAKTISNTEELTGDAAGFVHSITRFQTIVGLRSEYNIEEQAMKSYVQLVLAPRPDKYYLIELVSDPRGVFSRTTTTSCVGNPQCQTGQSAVTTWTNTDSLRLTFQFAKVYDFATFRFGIKESTGGVGLDLALADNFALYSDLFDTRSNTYPRLKVMGAYRFFEQLYVVAGIDDILNRTNWVGPGTLDPYHPGRDYFIGAWLKFNDDDLKGLLTIGGSAAFSGAAASGK
jgi:phospholipid/cholesterol/gamma-HCH transport system substrate-binding protein